MQIAPPTDTNYILFEAERLTFDLSVMKALEILLVSFCLSCEFSYQQTLLPPSDVRLSIQKTPLSLLPV